MHSSFCLLLVSVAIAGQLVISLHHKHMVCVPSVVHTRRLRQCCNEGTRNTCLIAHRPTMHALATRIAVCLPIATHDLPCIPSRSLEISQNGLHGLKHASFNTSTASFTAKQDELQYDLGCMSQGCWKTKIEYTRVENNFSV